MKLSVAIFFILLWCGANVSIAQTIYPRGTYSCQTADGRTITSDRPIPECQYREQRLIGSSGVTIAIIRPQINSFAQQAVDEKERIKEEEEERLRNQLKVLLTTYPNVQAHNTARQHQIAPLMQKLNSTYAELAALNRKLDTVKRDMASQKPSAFIQQNDTIGLIQRDISVQQHIANTLIHQISVINDEFDREYEFLLPYWKGGLRASPPKKE